MASQTITVQIVRQRACCRERAESVAEKHRQSPRCLGAIAWSFRGEHGSRAIYPAGVNLRSYRCVVEHDCRLEIPVHPDAPAKIREHVAQQSPPEPDDAPQTVAEFLEELGGIDRVVVDAAVGPALDWPATPQLMGTSGTGDLQVTCGGKVLLLLAEHPRGVKGKLYLVQDDERGAQWDADMGRRSVEEDYSPPVTPRPSPRLRVVFSI